MFDIVFTLTTNILLRDLQELALVALQQRIDETLVNHLEKITAFQRKYTSLKVGLVQSSWWALFMF